jgi:thermostable 8-oxoguanine DNA glycosylase
MKIQNITDKEIQEAKEILSAHVVRSLTKESALEAGIFTIASAGTPWDAFPTKLVTKLREISCSTPAKYDILSDQNLLRKLSTDLRWRFHHDNRFSSLIENFKNRPEDWWLNVLNADEKYRAHQTNSKSPEKIKYMAYKTFSFWHLCLGGKNLATLDIHVRRQLNERCNFNLDKNYISHQERPSTQTPTGHAHTTFDGSAEEIIATTYQRVSVEPPPKAYLEIETRMRDYFSKDERFLHNGQIDMSLATTLLWWSGAKREASGQLYLEGFEKGHAALPHAI